MNDTLTTPDGSLNAQQATRWLHIHGYLILASTFLIFPLSIIVVRLGSRWDLWAPTHIILATLGVSITAASIGFAIVGSQHVGHFSTAHQKISILPLVFVLLSVLQGLVISITWRPFRTRTPMRDRAHWWLGRLTLLVLFALCIHGCVITDWMVWPFLVFISLWCLLYVFV